MKYLSILIFSLAFYSTGFTQTTSDMKILNNEGGNEDSTALIIGFTNQADALEFKDLDLKSNCPIGLLIPSLYRKIPIYKDGLRPGDIITTIDGECFENMDELSNYIKTKNEKKITIQYYSYDTVKTIITELISLKEFEAVQQEFMNLAEPNEDGTFIVAKELADKYIDSGDPYKYFQYEKSSKSTHWDFQEYTNLDSAKEQAILTGKPILLALFGSYSCCSYISLTQEHYQNLMTEPVIQTSIKEKFVSILVLKPEAYTAYIDFNLQAGWPTLLILDQKGNLIEDMVLTPKTSTRKLKKFLEKAKKLESEN